MKLSVRAAILSLTLLLASAGAGMAAAKSFVVLPFAINGPAGYKYLSQAIPPMLYSRLSVQDNTRPVGQDSPLAKTVPADEAASEKARAALDADYVIWGSIGIVGEDCSLDVRVRDRSGKVWHRSRETRVAQLIPTIKSVSDNINSEVFGNAPAQTATAKPAPKQTEAVNQMNPEFVHNLDRPKEVYLNPQVRYSGTSADTDRLRSQQLPFASVGMEVGDMDGDGRNEIVILADKSIYAYMYDNGRLQPLGKLDFPLNHEALCLCAIDLNNDGRKEIVVNMLDAASDPATRVLNFDGKRFTEVATNVRYFMNVVDMPPRMKPTLIGQKGDKRTAFAPQVYEMIKNGGEFIPGTQLNLPKDFNVFNFVYLPAGLGTDGIKMAMISPSEKLRVYTERGARLSESDDKFFGSVKAIAMQTQLPGMGVDQESPGSMYFIPTRMLPVDLEKDGNYEMLVSRPYSTASLLFDRYRSFPESEIQSLFWDGSGMNLQWKTRRIKGSITDFTLADGNNDGSMDLVVCINTHPGALGFDSRKTMVFIYPLDTSKVDPGTEVDPSEKQ